MKFEDWQETELKAKLDPANVAERKQMGMTLSYIEGWHAIAEANRIFGFGGWCRETVELREARPAEIVKDKNNRDQWRVGYVCKVRVTVGDVVREGTGFGSGAMGDLGDAIESAIKEAETDAMKRALMTFGNPFGLALYDKSRENVGPPERSAMSLKKTDANGEDAWDKLSRQAAKELLDANTLRQLDKLRAAYRETVKADRWPQSWRVALGQLFDEKEKEIRDAESSEFPGDIPTQEPDAVRFLRAG